MGLLTWQLGKKVWMRVGERDVRSRSKNIKIFKKYLLVYIRQSTLTHLESLKYQKVFLTDILYILNIIACPSPTTPPYPLPLPLTLPCSLKCGFITQVDSHVFEYCTCQLSSVIVKCFVIVLTFKLHDVQSYCSTLCIIIPYSV